MAHAMGTRNVAPSRNTMQVKGRVFFTRGPFPDFFLQDAPSFVSLRIVFGRVAQLVRALGLHPRCRGFEPRSAHQINMIRTFIQSEMGSDLLFILRTL